MYGCCCCCSCSALWSTMTKVEEVFTLPLLFRADSVGLGVVRMNIFLHCEYCNFLMIFRCLSGHFWSDFSVQRTFPMDFPQTNSKPTPENDQVQRKSNGHSQRKSNGILTDAANGSPMEVRQIPSMNCLLLVLLIKNNQTVVT
jgi:hypothetical protein